MKRNKILLLSFLLLLLAFPAHANVMLGWGKMCVSDGNEDGLSETLSFVPDDFFLDQVYSDDPNDPLAGYIGLEPACSNLPKAKAAFADMTLTGELGYSPDPAYAQCAGDGEIFLEEKVIPEGYTLWLLDSATCTYVEVMKLDVTIRNAPLSNWCPFSRFAFEFNNAQVNNVIGSALLDYFASQPETPLSSGTVSMDCMGLCHDANNCVQYCDETDLGSMIRSGQSFCARTEFTHFPGVACSGCDDCGIESNGRMMTALAKRHYLRGRSAVCSDPSGEGVLCDRPMKLTLPVMSSGEPELSALLPDFDALGLQAVPTSPNDLIELTNAEDIIAMDHFKNGKTNGAILLVLTHNDVYEHTKTVCDRAAGEVLQKVYMMRNHGVDFPVAVIYNPKDGTRAFSSAFSVADSKVYARWRIKDYPTFDDATIYNVQLWAPTIAELSRLLTAEISKIESVVSDLKYDNEFRFSGQTYVMNVAKIGSDIRVNVGGEREEGLHLEGQYWPESKSDSPVDFEIPLPADRRLNHELPYFLDAQVKLVDADGVAIDEVYISDGAFAAFDDSVLGDGSSATTNTTNDGCARSDDLASDDLPLTGCASIDGNVDGYAVITRTLNGAASPYDFSDAGAITFRYRSATDLVLCLESQSRYGLPQTCTKIGRSGSWREAAINLDSLSIYQENEPAVLNDIVAISWNAWNPNRSNGSFNADFAIEDVTIRAKKVAVTTKTTEFSSGGCSQTTPVGGMLLLLALGALFALRRRSEATK